MTIPHLTGQREGFVWMRVARTARGKITNVGAVTSRASGRRTEPGLGRGGPCRSVRRRRDRVRCAALVDASPRWRSSVRRGRRSAEPDQGGGVDRAARRPHARVAAPRGERLAAHARAARRGDRRTRRAARARGARRVGARAACPPGRTATRAWVNADRVRLSRTRWRVEIDRSARTGSTSCATAGPCAASRRSWARPPRPRRSAASRSPRLARQPDPDGFLGPFALHLTAHSDVLDDYGGGPGRVAIHGRGGESLTDPLGSARSHGCIRVDNAEVRFLARHLVAGVPVTVAS